MIEDCSCEKYIVNVSCQVRYWVDFTTRVDILCEEVEMSQTAQYERMLDAGSRPTEKKIRETLGIRVAKCWKEMRTFLKMNYDFKPELVFYGRNYGWCYRYRRKGKTLCVLFPEIKAFTVLVVFGKTEIAQFQEHPAVYNKDTKEIFKNAYQYHDGKWLYKRVLNKSDVKDVKALIRIKKQSKK